MPAGGDLQSPRAVGFRTQLTGRADGNECGGLDGRGFGDVDLVAVGQVPGDDELSVLVGITEGNGRRHHLETGKFQIVGTGRRCQDKHRVVRKRFIVGFHS